MGGVAAEESLTQRLVFVLGKLGQLVTGRFAELLEPMGLRPRHCAVLELLGPAPMGQLELARRIGVAPSVVVDMLDELQALEAIRRVRDHADRRRHVVELTAKGRAQVERIIPSAHTLEQLAAAGVPAKDLAVVKRSLRRMYENIAGQPR